jgi:hypothetical protein
LIALRREEQLHGDLFRRDRCDDPPAFRLLDSVWEDAAEIDDRTVDVGIGRLRKALSRSRERDPIRTVRSAGYAFDGTSGNS